MSIQKNQPNVIFVTSHDTGTYFGCYGDKSINTPNIDKIASEGVLFTNNFCTAPLCSPSRGSIITGRYPSSNGLMGLINRGWDLPVNEKSLPSFFREAGYSTFLFGIEHERTNPLDSGYEKIFPATFSREIVDLFLEFLKNRRDKNPFYAAIGFFETHLPFNNPRFKPANPADVYLPAYITDNLETRTEMAEFHGVLKEMDDNIGKIADALRKTGFEENTIYIQTVDHGIAFPGAKSTLYDPGIKTALIIKWKDIISTGKICDNFSSGVDIAPTLLDFVGIPVPVKMQGKSLAPLLNNNYVKYAEEFWDEAVFCQKDWYDCYDPKRCIRTRNFKYIRNFETGPLLVLPADVMQTPAAKYIPERFRIQRPAEELYDLEKDPNEFHNIAEDSVYSEHKKQLRTKLDSWMVKTGDYLYGLKKVEEYWKIYSDSSKWNHMNTT